MAIINWLKQSPFSTPWFDAILFGVLLFEVLPFFLRARAARYGFTAASLLCQLGLLISCLFLGAPLTDTLIVLTVAALIAAGASLLEYRLFDREETVAECKVKAEEAARIAEERAVEFVLPIPVSAEKTAKTPDETPTERGDNAQ